MINLILLAFQLKLNLSTLMTDPQQQLTLSMVLC